MVFEFVLQDGNQAPIAEAALLLNNRNNGVQLQGYSDGNGYINIDAVDQHTGARLVNAGDLLVLAVNGFSVKANSTPDPRGPYYIVATTAADQKYTLTLASFRKPFQAAPGFWNGQMCGLNIPGLPFVAGMEGAPAGLFLSWFYDRYDAGWQATARAEMAKKYTFWLLSWPDSQRWGYTPEQFRDTCASLIRAGYFVHVMLSAKPANSSEIRTIQETWANIELVLPLLVGVVPNFCPAWEAALWMSPSDLQYLIDNVHGVIKAQPGSKQYVHLKQGYGSYQQDGKFFADFWNPNVEKLRGLLHEKIMTQTPDQYRYDSGGLSDILDRFAGNWGVAIPADGPFDLVALEIDAQEEFDGTKTTAEGDAMGTWAIGTPPRTGPGGSVGVQGSGNGHT